MPSVSGVSAIITLPFGNGGGSPEPVCDYLLLAPFDGAADQGYADAQVLDTEAEGVAVDQLTVLEVDGAAALASGRLQLSGKAAAGWTLGLYNATGIARALGRTFLLTHQQNAVATRYSAFGWHDQVTSINPGVADYVLRIGGAGGLVEKMGDSLTTETILTGIAVDTDYQYAFVLGGYDTNKQPWYDGAVGSFIYGCSIFIKGGVYTDWTLIWREAVQPTATVYPFISMYHQYGLTVLAEYLRVPDHDYSPVLQPTAADWFTDANGTSLDAHTPDVTPGGGWTEVVGNWQITGDQACMAAGASLGKSIISLGYAGGFHRVTATHNGAAVGADNSSGLVFRYVDSSNYWTACINNVDNVFYLQRYVAGVGATQDSAAVAITAGAAYEITVSDDGTSGIQAWLDGGDRLTASDATHATATVGGILARQSSDRIDNYHSQPHSGYTELDECPGYAVTP